MRSSLFVQSLEKAMKVLDVFSHGDQYISLGEIAALAGLERASAQRSVHTLVELGYLEKDPRTNRVSLGKRCLDLSFHYLRTHPLVKAATPVLMKLRNDCGERINMSLYDGAWLVHVIRLPGKQEDFFFSTLIGRRMPTFCSAGGRAMLSCLPTAEMEAIIARGDLSPLTRDTITEPKRIFEHIRLAGERGYGMAIGESARGELAVGAAIRDAAGRPLAAVHIAGNLSAWAPDLFETRFAPLVVEVAAALSAHAAPARSKAG